jgi:two-component system, chemotaxis family, sensor kinase CheA
MHSQIGKGTTTIIRIPLTLAVMQALLVTANGDRYAIAQSAVLELARLDKTDIDKRIDKIQDTYVYRLHNRLLPLLFLDAELQPARTSSNPLSADTIADGGTIVVLLAKDRHFALVVDEVADTQEIVVRPLGKPLKSLSVYAGATILGDGRVALILDVLGVARRGGVTSTVCDRVRPSESAPPDTIRIFQTHLIVMDARNQRLAIPLSQITRLEEFSRSAVEMVGEQQVVRYRNDVLPLFLLADLLPRQDAANHGTRGATIDGQNIHVVVYEKEGASIGLVVSRVSDIEEGIEVPSKASRSDGMSFPVVAQGQVMSILDLDEILKASTLPGLQMPAAQEVRGPR